MRNTIKIIEMTITKNNNMIKDIIIMKKACLV